MSAAEQFSIDTPAGILHISADADGVTSVSFADFHLEQQHANTEHGNNCSQQLKEYFAGQRTEFNFPFHQNGTEFQQPVWAELNRISFGETISYHELAVRLGDPKCIRAAGTANGKNQLAIIVPCHRVIGSDGSLTGYAGGLDKKEFLLKHEGVRLPGKQAVMEF
jgi:methylated-DNA-[protein]-cysteine S-methyltransferase